MKKVSCLLLFCTGMTLALVAMANGGEKIRCRAEPSRGEWHYRIVDEKRCWFRGYRKKYEPSELYWPQEQEQQVPVKLVPDHQTEGRPSQAEERPSMFDDVWHALGLGRTLKGDHLPDRWRSE
jgi:hypothetical protein